MREILFRGKRKDNGEWIQGDFCSPCNIVYLENGYDAVLGKDDCPMCNDFEVIPETVGQYTGLTDKNGKKIFEGDIVKAESLIPGSPFFEAKIGKVVYEECAFYVQPHNPMESEYLFADECADIEIIGNIHDNPELLKGGVQE